MTQLSSVRAGIVSTPDLHRETSGLRAAELAAFDGHHRLLWLLDQGLSPVSAADPHHPDSNATAIAGVDVEKYLALDRDRRLSFQSVSH